MLIKGISERVNNQLKKLKWGFLGMLAATLDTSLLSNILTSKRVGEGERTIRADQDF